MCDAFEPPCFARPYQRYEVYRKRNEVYVVGIDKIDKVFSILKIPTPYNVDPNDELQLYDGIETRLLRDLQIVLQSLRSSEGGLEKVETGSGLVGFIQLLRGYYLIIITKHRKAGKIGHHSVYCIEETKLIPLFGDTYRGDEKKFLDKLPQLNSKDYYFSYSYDVSRSVQQNSADALRYRLSGGTSPMVRPLYTEKDPLKHHRFVWNHFHMGYFIKKQTLHRWCLPIIHGFFQNAKCSSNGWTFEIALIARRSRFFAGTRYLKRGLNVDGHVANDVETEQLLLEDYTRHFDRGHVMSFVQMRGSVPLFWSQESNLVNPKPPIVYPCCDPTLAATRLHFADLLERYGTPQLVINLMKAKRQDSYEVRLSKHWESAIERLNREIPAHARVLYRPFDVKGHSKSESKEPVYKVFGCLAQSVVSRVGFFHTKHGSYGQPEQTQSGVVRTNCVDCLDRTNVLQFFVGLEVLKKQLTAVHLLQDSKLYNESQSQVAFILTELYDLMGDHLGLQYAGSKVHKKYQLLGSRPLIIPVYKEILTSVQRHYSNWSTDADRQARMNLFLGVYRPKMDAKFLEGEVDSWVHHKILKDNYVPGNWWDPALEAYVRNMSVLREPLPREIPRPPALDQLAWFRTVHKYWKLTDFTELARTQGLTEVKIHASGATTLQVRLTGEPERRKRPQKPVFALGMDDPPRRVSVEDLSKYTSYADVQKLSRLTWMLDLTLGLGLPRQPELSPCQALFLPGETVALYCVSLGSFARMGIDGKVIAFSPSAPSKTSQGDRSWELFTVVPAGRGQIALHSLVHNRFLRMSSVSVDGSVHKAAKDLPSEWACERFTVVGAGAGKVALHSVANNRFLRMSPSGLDVSDVASATEMKPEWTDVRFQVVKDGSCWESFGKVAETMRRIAGTLNNPGQAARPRSRNRVMLEQVATAELEAMRARYLQTRLKNREQLEIVGPKNNSQRGSRSPVMVRRTGTDTHRTYMNLPAVGDAPQQAQAMRLGLVSSDPRSRSDPNLARQARGDGPSVEATTALRREVPSRSPPPPRSALHPTVAMPEVKKVMCSYCGQLFYQDALEVVDRVEVFEQQLCPQDQHRASDLAAFRKSGSFVHQKWPQEEVIGQLIFRAALSPRKTRGSPPPWQRWIDVGQLPGPNLGLSGINSHSYDGRRHASALPHGPSSVSVECGPALGRYADRQVSALSYGTPGIPPSYGDRQHSGILGYGDRQQSAMTHDAALRDRYVSGSASTGGHSDPALLNRGMYEAPNYLNYGSAEMQRLPRTSTAIRQKPDMMSSMTVGSSADRGSMSLPGGAPHGGLSSLEAARSCGATVPPGPTVPGAEAALTKHLRCYVFPCSMPAAPELEELGLPSWWLRSLERPSPSLDAANGQDNSDKEGLGTDKADDGKDKKKKRGIKKPSITDRRPLITITPATAVQGLRIPQGTGSWSPRESGKSAKSEENANSVFVSNCILDELEAAERAANLENADLDPSPLGMCNKRTVFRGGHHRARSSMT